MNSSALAREIRERIVSEGAVRTDEIRRIRRLYSKSLAAEGARAILDLADDLLAAGGIVTRFVAYELVFHHPAAQASLTEKEVKKLGRGLESWGSVDCFACYISGPAWREGQISDRVIRLWAQSEDRWWRRAALVSTVPLNSKARGGHGDALRTLNVCKLLVGDRDDMVEKALSWALRELSKRDAQAVHGFLGQHRRVLSARVIREVGNKLSTGLKNPRKA